MKYAIDKLKEFKEALKSPSNFDTQAELEIHRAEVDGIISYLEYYETKREN